jgi:Skp family chaperone for outer membrane proteins
MNVKYSVFALVATCSALNIVAEDQAVSTTKTVPAKTNVVADKKVKIDSPSNKVNVNSFDISIGVCDLYTTMASSDAGKIKQKEMEDIQKMEANALEQQRQSCSKKLETFNAKKETLSKEAREKEEQELMALSRDLQNEVQKAQERIRGELSKATEELARAVEEAAVSIAKADHLDLLIDKNTGRVVYSKDSYDLTPRIEAKMNENYKIALAKDKKAADTLTASAKDAPKESIKTVATEASSSAKATADKRAVVA